MPCRRSASVNVDDAATVQPIAISSRVTCAMEICLPLVRILQHGCSFSKSEAVGALCSITMRDSDHRAAVVAAGAVPPLVALVEGGDRSVKLNALLTLTNLAQEDDLTNAVFVAGAIRPLVVLLRSDDDDANKMAASLLKTLAYARTYGTAIEAQLRVIKDVAVAAGAVPALIKIVKTGSGLSKEQAALALSNLAFHDNQVHHDNQVLVAADGVVPLLDLLRDGNDSCKNSAAMALRNLSLWLSDNRVAIAAAGAIPLLVAAETGSHAGAENHAAVALHNLGIGNADNQVAIAKARGAEALVRIARRGRIELPWQGRVLSYLPSAGARERVARLLAARRSVIICKILEDALPPEIAASVVAPFLGRWGGSWP